MNNLTTRKIVLGLLLALGLAFSIQGNLAEALTLTETSPVVQSKRMGSTFEVSFRVGLTGNRVQYHPDYSNRRINANDQDDTTYVYIDSQGFEVTYIGETSRSYRNTDGTAVSDPTGGTFVYGSQPSYSDAGTQGTVISSPSDAVILVDTSGNLYHTSGNAVYIRRGDGTSDTNPVSPWRYTRATLSNTMGIDTADKVANDSDLHDFNDEAIGITFPAGAGTVKLKNPSFVFGSVDTPTDLGASYTTGGQSLRERVRVGLPSSVTLVCEGAQEGSHDIVIWDATYDNDFPLDGVPDANQPRQSITFTLHVTPSTTDIGATDTISPDIQRIAVEDAVEPVSEHLDFEPATGNNRIRYEVVRGSGTLYVGTLEDEHTTPSTVLSVHQSSNVYLKTNNSSNEVHVWFAGEDRSAPRATIVFEYRGQALPATRTTPTTPPTPPTPPVLQTPRLTISVSGTGTTRTVTVNAFTAANTSVPGISVTLNGTALAASQQVVTGTPTTITLPSAPGSYTLVATHPAAVYAQGTATVTIAAVADGTLTISPSGAPVNGIQNISITARESDGGVPSDAFTVTLRGTGFTTTTATVLAGSVTAPVRLPTTAGTYTLTASATGYNSATTRLVVGGPTTTPGTTTPITTGGEPDSLEIDGQRLRSGVVNEQLDAPLRVRVIDANDRGVSGVRVTFRVLSPARGTFAGARGAGTAVLDETDRNGYASAEFTPTSAGDVVVRANTGKVSPVTFILDINGVSETATDTRTPGPDVTPSREINPVVHIGAANRPPMLWVDGGKIYALVGADVQEFGSGVAGAMNVAIGDGKVYWTEMTGESSGTINSANLDGTDVKELKSIMAVPMGITVDTAGSKLYWTNSRGRIQSLNADGSGRVENVMLELPNPMDIAVARGILYWTQFDATAGEGKIGIVNPARKIATYIPTGADAPGSLVIGNGKVYWTEMTGTSSGTINSANLNRSDVKQLASILAAPSGIAVDTARSKLYWTNSRGRIQSADLNGKKIQNVVDGLGMPGDMVLNNSIKAPAATTTPTTPTTASNKYDINGDGTVDSTDVDALLLAVLAELTNAKYDVNGDGAVDVKDVQAVNANLDTGAAAAPALLGTKLSMVQIDRLQEQIDLLIATGDRSPAALKTLIYLQQLIVMARPEKTQLLANYPNPFNPETWIPYELATDTTVKITIYNTHGVVVRTLELGHQSAGYYTGRDRAAYWDGRNAFGEQVASGVYFYQFETDDMSSMRKMVILK